MREVESVFFWDDGLWLSCSEDYKSDDNYKTTRYSKIYACIKKHLKTNCLEQNYQLTD